MAKPSYADAAKADPTPTLFAVARDIFARLVAAGATQSKNPEAVAAVAIAHARAFLRAWDASQHPAAPAEPGALTPKE